MTESMLSEHDLKARDRDWTKAASRQANSGIFGGRPWHIRLTEPAHPPASPKQAPTLTLIRREPPARLAGPRLRSDQELCSGGAKNA